MQAENTVSGPLPLPHVSWAAAVRPSSRLEPLHLQRAGLPLSPGTDEGRRGHLLCGADPQLLRSGGPRKTRGSVCCHRKYDNKGSF